MSTVTVCGNIARDPELRYSSGGAPMVKFSIAENRRYQKAGEWTEEVGFYDVICWGQLGENAAVCLSKGDRVVVSGRLAQRSWESPEGTKRSAVEIVADMVGPDLRFATVVIEKTARQDTTNRTAAAPDDSEPF